MLNYKYLLFFLILQPFAYAESYLCNTHYKLICITQGYDSGFYSCREMKNPSALVEAITLDINQNVMVLSKKYDKQELTKNDLDPTIYKDRTIEFDLKQIDNDKVKLFSKLYHEDFGVIQTARFNIERGSLTITMQSDFTNNIEILRCKK